MSPARNCETFGPAEYQAAMDELSARVGPLKSAAKHCAEQARLSASFASDRPDWAMDAQRWWRLRRKHECAVSRMLGQRWTVGGVS